MLRRFCSGCTILRQILRLGYRKSTTYSRGSSESKRRALLVSYIDSYFNQNILLYRTISYFGCENIDALTWIQVMQCVDILKIKGLNEDCLFDEFTKIKSTFKTLLSQRKSIFDQVQAFINNQNDITAANKCSDESEDDNDSTINKVIRFDQLWMFIFSLTPSSNF
ncbi:unnamed protein product [Rotaria socialis]|uniref:Uncharacterized protein n=2 Tax=Rotaria socialis TaxID=392032 RepID=A0A817ZQS7_9BILA|nr:unnamed protein product [Rotaria socialis]CAF3339685.1 unnamed protein product [Rotaria socialis]CAF3392319.1 unnamed protein product [Rotaria socialis]CAF4283872.1 unnamed protein product [Rotaria socialis]CAF4530914.1 unnamed protein product [Rotaria socialis]